MTSSEVSTMEGLPTSGMTPWSSSTGIANKLFTPSPNMVPLGPPFSHANSLNPAAPATSFQASAPLKYFGGHPRVNFTESTDSGTRPTITSSPSLASGVSPLSERRQSSLPRESSPAVSDASSDRTHISSGMRPVLQIPPFVPADSVEGELNPSPEPPRPFGEQDLEPSSSEDESKIKPNRQPNGPAHGSLPRHLQKLLSQYYQLNGTNVPPPCAMNKIKQTQLEGRRTGRHPLKYVNKDGERLNASCLPIGFSNKYVLVVEGKTQAPVIVRYHSITGTPAAQKRTPYLVWKGIEGWEKEPSIWKVRDEEAISITPPNAQGPSATLAIPKSGGDGSTSRVTSKVPTPKATPTVRPTVTTSSSPKVSAKATSTTPVQTLQATKNCQICKDRHRRCDKILPSCSTCIELNTPCHYARSSLPASTPNAVAVTIDSKDNANLRSSKPTPNAEPKRLSPQSDDSGSEVDLESELPSKLRTVLEEWYKQQGSRLTPPCSLSSANAHSIYAFVGSGMPAKYVDLSGRKLELKRHFLPENKSWANVIYGLDNEPVFVKAQNGPKVPDFGNNQAAYAVWHGVKGLEETPRVYKVADPEKHAKRRSLAAANGLLASSPGLGTKRARDDVNDDGPAKRPRTINFNRDIGTMSPILKSVAESTRSNQRRTGVQDLPDTPQHTSDFLSPTESEVKPATTAACPKTTLPRVDSLHAIAPAASSILSSEQKSRTSVTFIGGNRPRTRPFTVADSVQKLYMQGSAAGLFEKLGYSTSIPFLNVKVGDETLAVIRDDEDDFRDLETLILTNGPWGQDEGTICHVEVRATEGFGSNRLE